MSNASNARALELDAIKAIYDVVEVGATGSSFEVRPNDYGRLRFILPDQYPECEPLRVSVVEAGSKRYCQGLSLRLNTLAESLSGREAVLDIIQEFCSLQAAASEVMGEESEPECEHCVLRIDHMNDRASYMRRLKRWGAKFNILAACFLRLAPSPGRPTRCHHVLLVLQGFGRNIDAFLKHLHTALVDVDAQGTRCKERRSTVVCRFVCTDSTERLQSAWYEAYSESAKAHDLIEKNCVSARGILNFMGKVNLTVADQ